MSVACAAHRLALSGQDATKSVPYMGTFRDHLQQLHSYFRRSANRTASLKMAEQTLGIDHLKVKEVKDKRWLSQDLAVQNIQRNLPAVLAALANESEVNGCPTAKGLSSFLATYRFVAAVHLQADVLPHLTCLSKLFQKEKVNFLAVKYQVPVTVAALRRIKDAGDNQPPGSFLSRLNQDLDDPAGLSAFGIVDEEERGQRGTDHQEMSGGKMTLTRCLCSRGVHWGSTPVKPCAERETHLTGAERRGGFICCLATGGLRGTFETGNGTIYRGPNR